MDILFLVFWFFALLLMLSGARLAGAPLSKFSLPSFVLTSLLVLQFIGYPALYFKWFEGRAVENGVNDQVRIFYLAALAAASILLVEAGMLIGRVCLPVTPRSEAQVSWDAPGTSISQVVSLITFGMSCFLVFLVYFVRVDSTALGDALFADEKTSLISRLAMTNAFPGKYHWYQGFMHFGLQFLTFAAYGLFLARRSLLAALVFIFLFGGLAIASIVAMEKMPLMVALLGLLIVHAVCAWGGQYRLRGLLLPGVVAVAVLGLLFAVSMQYSAPLTGPLVTIASRTFTGQIVPAYWYLEFFPDHHDFLWGASFPNPMGIFPFEPFNLTREVWRWKHPLSVAEGIAGSAPTVFWGEVYANFGTAWIFVSSAMVGFGLWVVHWIFSRLPRTPLEVALLAWCAVHFMKLSLTGLSMFVIDTNLFVVLLMYLTIRIGVATFPARPGQMAQE